MIAIAAVCARIEAHLFEDSGASNRPLWIALAFAAPLAYYPLSFWTLMGMETGRSRKSVESANKTESSLILRGKMSEDKQFR